MKISAAVMLACLLTVAAPASAQGPGDEAEPLPPPASATVPSPATEPSAPEPGSTRWSPGDIGRFLAGGALGLGMHEAGHVSAAALYRADPGVRKVEFGPLPFFAITHERISPAREHVVAAAGFWVQHATSEWLLTRRPDLRREHAPIAKGVLAFNVLTSVAYASAAFGNFGPLERDTRAIAGALGVGEPAVGALILAPAALDTWRYFSPRSRWARWASRGAKVLAVLVVARSRAAPEPQRD